ncbi:MAG: hypothetical protein ACTIKC_01995 [Psychrobacter sp.]
MTTKRQVIAVAKKYFGDDSFDIELYKDNDKKMLTTHNSINLYIDIEYQDNRDKDYIYNCIIELLQCFDFSYTLEYYSIEALENCPFLTNIGY